MREIVGERIARARAELEQRGCTTGERLPSEITASWSRCLAAGLDPLRPPRMQVVEEAVLRRERERHDHVARLAMAEMRSLYHQISGSNYVIAFAAPAGMLLESLTDPTFLPTAKQSGIRPGALWTEATRGTNALGTVIEIRRTLTVHGGEHFFRQFGGLTCAAAPVFGPDAELAGVLDASSDCRSRQQHTQALVAMAVTQIENGLFRAHHSASLILAFHSRSEYLHTSSAGLLAIGPDGTLLGANAPARLMLQGLPALPGRRFDEVFRSRFEALLEGDRGQQQMLLRDRVGSTFVAVFENLRPARIFTMPTRRPQPAAQRPPFVARDPAVADAVRQVEAAARCRWPILIRGETGTGKEELARHAHRVSGRQGEFVPVNCAAIPETLIESELFGHAEGAFTGARRRGAAGLVLQADGGTLFLDEIGDMRADVQAVLLRLLDDWMVRPVGGARSRQVDVLLITATNANLAQRMAEGTFRADLFYRLGIADVCLPPLARRTDFQEILLAMLRDIAPEAEISPEVPDYLATLTWPGNIRELRNVLGRLTLARPDGAIDLATVTRLLGEVRPAVRHVEEGLRQSARSRIVAVYGQEGGNVSRVARRLGVSRNTIYRAMRRD
jgi:transcriptional regulator of acetoin/glycerol metabolism